MRNRHLTTFDNGGKVCWTTKSSRRADCKRTDDAGSRIRGRLKMPVPRRENHSEEMTDRIRDEPKACSLSGFFLAEEMYIFVLAGG